MQCAVVLGLCQMTQHNNKLPVFSNSYLASASKHKVHKLQGVYVPFVEFTCMMMYLWWSLCTLYLLAHNNKLLESSVTLTWYIWVNTRYINSKVFMYLSWSLRAWWCTSDGVYVPCIYLHTTQQQIAGVFSNSYLVYMSKHKVHKLQGVYVPFVEFTCMMMYLWWSLCTLCLLACQVRVTVGDFVFVVVLWCLSGGN